MLGHPVQSSEMLRRNRFAPDLESDLDAAPRASVAGRQPRRLVGNSIPIARTRLLKRYALGTARGRAVGLAEQPV